MKDNYTSPYAKNVPSMYNTEVVALAKNRFTDEETMLAIAKWDYRLGQSYLAANENITDEAAKVLWEKRGYVLKSELLRRGRIKLKKNEYTEVYRKYFKNNNRSHWRMMSAFLGGGYWQRNRDDNCTPSELLEEIYADFPTDELTHAYTLEQFIDHQNCSLELAIKISTTPDPPKNQHYYQQSFADLRRKALMKVAEITKQQLEAR
jgi:hypothetical protein